MFVTPHAQQRFKERFRLQFNPEVFKDGRAVFMLRKLFDESVEIDFALRQQTGKYNALCIKHGYPVRISRTRNVVFIHSDKAIHTVMVAGMYVAGMQV